MRVGRLPLLSIFSAVAPSHIIISTLFSLKLPQRSLSCHALHRSSPCAVLTVLSRGYPIPRLAQRTSLRGRSTTASASLSSSISRGRESKDGTVTEIIGRCSLISPLNRLDEAIRNLWLQRWPGDGCRSVWREGVHAGAGRDSHELGAARGRESAGAATGV